MKVTWMQDTSHGRPVWRASVGGLEVARVAKAAISTGWEWYSDLAGEPAEPFPTYREAQEDAERAVADWFRVIGARFDDGLLAAVTGLAGLLRRDAEKLRAEYETDAAAGVDLAASKLDDIIRQHTGE